MVIVSAKISKQKILLGLLIAVCVVVLLVFLIGKSEKPIQQAEEQQPIATAAQSLSGGTNDERIAFLSSFGWNVEPTPTETQEVRIPQEFNDVFTRYNQIQIDQGFDLSNFAGKTAKRYVYTITNYPNGSSGHYATVLVHKNKIIGGDITSSEQGGSMHGFQMPG